MELRTSGEEVKQLIVAWLALTVGFTLLMTDPLQAGGRFNPSEYVVTFLTAFVTAGAGFLLHELAHKIVAQKYGYWAEFRADYEMLVVTIASGAFGFLFAAPGAVEIRGRRIDERSNGIIALAGPATNVSLFVVFASLSLVFSGGTLGFVASFGAFINALLAAFNMVPFGPLDGTKVFDWDKRVFGVAFAVCAALAAYSFFSFLG
ncbi:MAG: metalloprotease [Halobacteriales archaeon]|nr:metalloprotease [Halobacteriales archaeon]